MPVQNGISKISADPNVATNLLQILISTTFNRLLWVGIGPFFLKMWLIVSDSGKKIAQNVQILL